MFQRKALQIPAFLFMEVLAAPSLLVQWCCLDICAPEPDGGEVTADKGFGAGGECPAAWLFAGSLSASVSF